MASFETCLRWLTSDDRPPGRAERRTPYLQCFAAGCFAGGAAWTSTYPFDVVRNIMMGDNINPAKRKFRGVWHCASTIVAEGGAGALWRGYLPCMLRGVPVNGVIFCVYTAISEELGRSWAR